MISVDAFEVLCCPWMTSLGGQILLLDLSHCRREVLTLWFWVLLLLDAFLVNQLHGRFQANELEKKLGTESSWAQINSWTSTCFHNSQLLPLNVSYITGVLWFICELEAKPDNVTSQIEAERSLIGGCVVHTLVKPLATASSLLTDMKCDQDRPSIY
jgi:hypothetical protein